MKVAEQTYYLDAGRTKALPAKPYKQPKEGEAFDETPDGAAFLLVRKGSEVTAEMTEKYGVKGAEREEAKAEPGIVTTSADEEGRQGFAAAQTAAEAGVVVTGEGRDAAASEGEAGGAEAATRKAATKAPAKKAAGKK